MKGFVKTLKANKQFGFIKGPNNKDYFFHISDFVGYWLDLVEDFDKSEPNPIEVIFEPVESPKGLRAANVRRTDFPNQAA